jgi:hypothetical protein
LAELPAGRRSACDSRPEPRLAVLRTCVHRLGEHLDDIGFLGQVDNVLFCTRTALA